MPDKKMTVISLGWGCQSFTLAAMVALGELELVDAVIHADTTHERSATYEFAKRWTPWLQEHGINVRTVQDGNPNVITDRPGGKIFIPAFTATQSANGGMLRRQCTQQWKLAPMRRHLQANRGKQPVEMWIGISLDEAERMKPSDVKYITNRWPLIEKRMTRSACIAWLERHGLEVPVKSSCAFCPYHNRAAWHEMKRENGLDWQKAVAVDAAIRKTRPPFDLFVHPDRVPLPEIRSPQDNGQLELWSEECSGMCFV